MKLKECFLLLSVTFLFILTSLATAYPVSNKVTGILQAEIEQKELANRVCFLLKNSRELS